MRLTLHPLTPERWPDLEEIFRARGCSVARNCWCMYYRRTGARSLVEEMTRREANRRDLKKLAGRDSPAGLIGYRAEVPVGWISLGPRADYKRLERPIVMKPVDGEAVRSIVCFVVPSQFRPQGVARKPLAGPQQSAGKRAVKALP